MARSPQIKDFIWVVAAAVSCLICTQGTIHADEMKSNGGMSYQIYTEVQLIRVPIGELERIAKKLGKETTLPDASFLPEIFESGKYELLACSGGATASGTPMEIHYGKMDYMPESWPDDGKLPEFGDPSEFGSVLKITSMPSPKHPDQFNSEIFFVRQILAGFQKFTSSVEMPIINTSKTETQVTWNASRDEGAQLLGGSVTAKDAMLCVRYMKRMVSASNWNSFVQSGEDIKYTLTLLEIPRNELGVLTSKTAPLFYPDAAFYSALLKSKKTKIVTLLQTTAGISKKVVLSDVQEKFMPRDWERNTDPGKELSPLFGDSRSDGTILRLEGYAEKDKISGTLMFAKLGDYQWRTYGAKQEIKMPIFTNIIVHSCFELQNGVPQIVAKFSEESISKDKIYFLYLTAGREQK